MKEKSDKETKGFASFFTQAMKDKQKKVKKGKYKGQNRSIKTKDLPPPGPAYQKSPGGSDAPSASTFSLKG